MCIPGQCDRRWAVVWAVESAPITTDLGRIAGEKHSPPSVKLPKNVALDDTLSFREKIIVIHKEEEDPFPF